MQGLVSTAAIALIVLSGLAVSSKSLALQPQASQTTTPQSKTRVVGTVKAVNGATVVVMTDTGSEMSVVVEPTTRLLRMAPGQTDLKSAIPAQLQEVQVGDRLLTAGILSANGKAVNASSAVIMKKADIEARQEHEREDWQKRGVGGVVKSIDPAGGTITISTGALGATNSLAVHVSKTTIIRRYALDSVKFDDAKPGTLDQIKPGDQLRARGTKSDDGKELVADEIVSGTFRNIAGTVISTDAGNSTITVNDLATKRPVTMKVIPDSQLHKLPPTVAQRIAIRLKGGVPGAPGGAGYGGGSPAAARNGDAAPGGMGPGGSRPGGGGPPDFQQMLNHMPAVTLAELQKGEAVMIVATEGSAETPSSAIILLSGVEPILTAAPSQASTILSPWNLSTGGNIGTGDTP